MSSWCLTLHADIARDDHRTVPSTQTYGPPDVRGAPPPNRLNRWPRHMGYTSQSNHVDLKPRQRPRAINNLRSKTHGESTLELKAAPNALPSVSERNRQPFESGYVRMEPVCLRSALAGVKRSLDVDKLDPRAMLETVTQYCCVPEKSSGPELLTISALKPSISATKAVLANPRRCDRSCLYIIHRQDAIK